MTTETLREELDAMVWLFRAVRGGERLPVLEARAVVHCLHVALQADRDLVLSASAAADVDVHNAVQAINVALTAMAAAHQMELVQDEVIAIGLAGLLHDIGMVRVPTELLNKSDHFTAEDREAVMRHPADGAAIILETDAALAVAAVAAYEHHIKPDGGGYPRLTYPRSSHRVSRLIAVCATFHALTSPRPFRHAWSRTDALTILEAAAARDLDGELVRLVASLLRDGAAQPAQGS